MKSWLNKWFSFSWKQLALVVIVSPTFWLVRNIDFGRMDALNRDALQYFNNASKVEKSLVTININSKVNNFDRPLNMAQLRSLINNILKAKPKHLIIALSNSDLLYGDHDIRKEFISFINNRQNIYMFATGSVNGEDVTEDEILNQYPRQIRITTSLDKNVGPRDSKRRRLMISLDRIGPGGEFAQIEQLGFTVKSPEFYQYTNDWWGAKMAYFKAFPEGTFGSYDAGWILNQENVTHELENKTVILGTNDEYSFLYSHSVFDLVGKISSTDYKAYPIADTIANAMNMYITGDYMKVSRWNKDLHVLFVVLLILVFIKIDTKKKILIFATLIPLTLLVTTCAYVFTDFYVNVTRSIALLFFLQYIIIPFTAFNIFKQQESKKLQEINDTRIDALLMVSEKVAHDIRSPLSVINLISDKVKFDDPEFKDIFSQAVQRIDETATKILTRYRTQTGNEAETTETINLKEICSTLIKEKQVLNNQINFEFKTNADTELAKGLRLDLERIISNIIDNSIFALSKITEPRVMLTLNTRNEFLQLTITDNGSGIPEQVLKLLGTSRITTKAKTGNGNGIGLLHAKRVIERLNGQFEINSRENVGTTINISLPKA